MEKPNNTTHIESRRPSVWLQFTTTIKESIQAHLTLVHIFHAITL
jgi:hypothetical protein